MNQLQSKNEITSLELTEQINVFRRDMEGKAELKHKTLLDTIRDEFEDEISEQKILPSEYVNARGKSFPMFILTLDQAKQVLMKESKVVRKAMIAYINKLEEAVRNTQIKAPQTPMDWIGLISQQMVIHNEQLIQIEGRLEDHIANQPLTPIQAQELERRVKREGTRTLGGKNSPAYNDRSTRGKVYTDYHGELRRQHQVSSYKAIKSADLDKALAQVDSHEIPEPLQEQIENLNGQGSLF